MTTLVQGGGRLPWKAVALSAGLVFAGSLATAQVAAPCPTGAPCPNAAPCPNTPPCPNGAPCAHSGGCLHGHAGELPCEKCARRHYKIGPGVGTLGYGPPGLFPGFQGFGLGFHLGYGYGGCALGTGAEGGYPFYGGPGYPHPWPALSRHLAINPFPYFGGPGYPTPECPNFYGGVGSLYSAPPVIEIAPEPGEAPYFSGFGPNSGAYPYSEEQLAPFTSRAAARGSGSGVSTPPGTSPEQPRNPGPTPTPAPDTVPSAPVPRNPENTPPPPPTTDGSLGIDALPVVEGVGTRGMTIAKVYPGSPAEKAGLHTGDVIHSINGYVTQIPGHLEWIMLNAAPERTLILSVRSATDRDDHTVRTTLR